MTLVKCIESDTHALDARYASRSTSLRTVYYRNPCIGISGDVFLIFNTTDGSHCFVRWGRRKSLASLLKIARGTLRKLGIKAEVFPADENSAINMVNPYDDTYELFQAYEIKLKGPFQLQDDFKITSQACLRCLPEEIIGL